MAARARVANFMAVGGREAELGRVDAFEPTTSLSSYTSTRVCRIAIDS